MVKIKEYYRGTWSIVFQTISWEFELKITACQFSLNHLT